MMKKRARTPVWPAHLPPLRRRKSGAARGMVFLFVAAQALALSLLTGCASFSRLLEPRAQVLRVTGFGDSSAREAAAAEEAGEFTMGVRKPSVSSMRRKPGVDFPKWGTQTLEARASAPVSQEATSYVEATMLARQAARDEAYRQLAARVAALPTPKGSGTVGEILKSRPKDKAEVEKIIRGCEFAFEGQGHPEQSETVARLNLEPIALLLYGRAAAKERDSMRNRPSQSPLPRRLGNVEVPTEPLQRKAFDRAFQDARNRMLGSLKQVRLLPNYTVGNLMAVNKEAVARVNLALDYYARVDHIRYPRPGACEVDLSLNASPTVNNLKTLMH